MKMVFYVTLVEGILTSKGWQRWQGLESGIQMWRKWQPVGRKTRSDEHSHENKSRNDAYFMKASETRTKGGKERVSCLNLGTFLLKVLYQHNQITCRVKLMKCEWQLWSLSRGVWILQPALKELERGLTYIHCQYTKTRKHVCSKLTFWDKPVNHKAQIIASDNNAYK